MVSLGLSGDRGAPAELSFSSLISCLCADLPGPVACSLKRYCLSSEALIVSISLPLRGLWGALRSRVRAFSYPDAPTWQHHKHPLREDSCGDTPAPESLILRNIKKRNKDRKKEVVLNEEQRVRRHAALTTAISLKLNAA